MKIGIIVAMGKELELLIPILKNHSTTTFDNVAFHTGTIGPNSIVALQCGIGKVNAAFGTQNMINHYSPDCIINTGVAGGADSSVNVLDVVIGTQVAYHDVWCGQDYAPGQLQGFPLYFNTSKEMADVLTLGPNKKKGLICSGDQFIDNIDKIKEIKNNFPQVLAVDMESTAIAHVCYLKHVPFLSVRVISDSPLANANNMQQYKDFWTKAPAETFEILKELITKIK